MLSKIWLIPERQEYHHVAAATFQPRKQQDSQVSSHHQAATDVKCEGVVGCHSTDISKLGTHGLHVFLHQVTQRNCRNLEKHLTPAATTTAITTTHDHHCNNNIWPVSSSLPLRSLTSSSQFCGCASQGPQPCGTGELSRSHSQHSQHSHCKNSKDMRRRSSRVTLPPTSNLQAWTRQLNL